MAAKKSSGSGPFAVIIAGGSGTRFWPLSRAARPKQFLALATKQPLLVDTRARLKRIASPSRTLVVCGTAHARAVRRLLTGVPAKNVLVEPEARNTAPAIALACVEVLRHDPKGVLVVVPADQAVADVPAFEASVAEAVRVAEKGYLVTLGITPTRPETGYGYIRQGAPLVGEARRVEAFVEKPDLVRAQGYFASGGYLWNAGLFVFRADVMLQALEDCQPTARGALIALAQAAVKQKGAALAKAFRQLPKTSIDYAVAEKATNLAVVPCACGWSDVGSFDALPQVRPADADGNVVLGEGAVVLDCKDSVIIAGKRPLAVVGMRGVVVVDAGDAVLVVPKARCQDVKQVVEALKLRKRSDVL